MIHLMVALILLLANGTAVVQPLPNLHGAVCVTRFGEAVAQCYQPQQAIAGTSGFVAKRFAIKLKVVP